MKLTTELSPSSTEKQMSWGHIRFVSKADLATSGCFNDDCLVIKCIVNVSKLINDAGKEEHDMGSIVVPPSNFTQDLHSLLGSVVCLLRARLSLVHAELCDSVMESTISIEDMDAEVFEVLLHWFVEQNTEEEATSIARRLLVVADRYEVERLKLMCESKRSKVVDVSTVCYVLILAKQHKCRQLQDFCLKYIATDRERLEVTRGTEVFKKLKKEYPTCRR